MFADRGSPSGPIAFVDGSQAETIADNAAAVIAMVERLNRIWNTPHTVSLGGTASMTRICVR
jgi:hypothetical protein